MADAEARAQIIIEAVNNASSGLGQVSAQLSAVASSSSEASSSNRSTIGSFTELNSIMMISDRVMSGLKDAYDGTVGAALDMADAERQLAMAGQISVEEAGSLITVGNDLGVSTGTLRNAFRMMAKDGMQPTIENIQKLAAQYQAIKDPTEKLQFAQKELGRSYQAMLPFLEQTPAELQRLTDEAKNSGVVMGGPAVDAARKYQISLNELGDRVEALKIRIGTGLIPVLSTITQNMVENSDRTTTLDQAYQSGIISADEYHQKLAMLAQGIQLTSSYTEHLNQLMQPSRDGWQNDTTAVSAYSGELDRAADRGNTEVTTLDHLIAKNNATERAQRDNAAASQELAKQFADINRIQDQMKAKQDSWLGGTAGQVQQALQNAGVSGKAYRDALAAVDSEYNTSLANDQAKQDAIDKLAKKYRDGELSAKDFQQGLSDIETQFMPGAQAASDKLDDAMNKAYLHRQDHISQLTGPYPDALTRASKGNKDWAAELAFEAQANGPIYNYLVGLQQIVAGYKDIASAARGVPPVPGGGGPSTGGGASTSSRSGQPRASGGPVTASNLYVVGERGPELFVPNTSGTIIPNGSIAGGGGAGQVVMNVMLDGRVLFQAVRANARAGQMDFAVVG